MLKKLFILASLLILPFAAATDARAQDSYYFQVSKLDVNVYWNADGTMSLDYVWVFFNQPGAHAIDFVDVGMPNSSFDMGTVSADVDGVPVSVSRGDYQGSGSGFAVVLGDKQIPAGASGVVHVYVGRITDVLHPDTDDETYASAVFIPTWFGAQYVTGKTEMTVNFHLPPNMAENEPRWHSAPGGFPAEPYSYYDEQNRIVYSWYSPDAQASARYEFGASFPRSYVPPESIVVPPAVEFNGDVFWALCFGCIFFVIFILSPIVTAIQQNRRKLQYFPPKIAVEGHGIKRGLTAVEAATLLEQPLDKVMTMILFGVIKKNAAKVKTRDPLELEIAEPTPEGLHPYEKSFLAAFKNPDKRERQTQLQTMTVELIKGVSEKLRGFSRKETADYYKAITEKAWKMVEEAETPEVQSQRFDEALEWTMLDKDYDERARRTFRGPIIVPRWWRHYDPTYRPAPASAAPVSLPSSGGPRQGLPGAEFAASIVKGTQTFSQKVLGDVKSFTEKVTGKTNPPPVVPSSGSRSGGGGRSCACACACAGCACACAGGGR